MFWLTGKQVFTRDDIKYAISIARVTQIQMNAPMTSVSFTFFGEVCKKMEIKIVIVDLQC